MFECRVSEIEFRDGIEINVQDSDFVIFVGANNCGKTRILNEVFDEIRKPQNPHASQLIINRCLTNVTGTFEDAMDWFSERHHVEENIVRIINRYMAISSIEQVFNSPEHQDEKRKNDYHALVSFISDFVRTDDRLKLIKEVESVDFHKPEKIKYPTHFFQVRQDLLKIISDAVYDAFGIHISIDMKRCDHINFRVGKEPDYPDRLSYEYQTEQENQRLLTNEGDGIRAFVGCLLTTIIGIYKIIFIDEPELFLHPPQAKRLGRALAESAKVNGQQVIVATHSSEFIQGVLAVTNNVAIVRLNRIGNTTHAHQISNEELKELWEKPLLKSAGAISGLFHEGVIVCEGDSDVRFYESLMRRNDRQGIHEKPADFYFVHGGSKAQLHNLADSYNTLEIPTAVIADFDIFQKRNDLRDVVISLGHQFTNTRIEDLYNAISQELKKLGGVETFENTITQLKQLITNIEDKKYLSRNDIGRFREIMEDGVDWGEAKKHGISSKNLKAKMNVHELCEELIDRLARIGLFVVPIGTLESWDSTLPSRKQKWIIPALELIDKDLNSFTEAADFVRRIAVYLTIQTQLRHE